ncbi:MAG: tRNA (guanosine(46)-N7)-methyltransferase TrmB [Bacteroidota bacterium]
MPRRKLKKITEVRTFKNVFDYKNENIKQELSNYFGNNKPFTLELGCGQADYTINMALLYPHKNFIGVDRKPNRIWNASKNADKLKLKNVAFLIAYIEHLADIFPESSIEEIWITFPDPYPRRSSMKKRLTHPRFLEIYKNILIDKGIINLKTDDNLLYEYTLDVIDKNNLALLRETNDLYSSNNLTDKEKILTKYEKQHLEEGKKIKLISFNL